MSPRDFVCVLILGICCVANDWGVGVSMLLGAVYAALDLRWKAKYTKGDKQ